MKHSFVFFCVFTSALAWDSVPCMCTARHQPTFWAILSPSQDQSETAEKTIKGCNSTGPTPPAWAQREEGGPCASQRGCLHFLAVSSIQTVFVRRERNAIDGSAAASGKGETKIICDHWLCFLCMCLCVCPVPSLSGKLHACLGWKKFMERAPWSQGLLKSHLHCP